DGLILGIHKQIKGILDLCEGDLVSYEWLKVHTFIRQQFQRPLKIPTIAL
ncbi:unnamed protein product, partial [marine sediment metagenome]